MPIIYDLFTRTYGGFMRAAASFNDKARKWVDGRKEFPKDLKANAHGKKFYYWFHCASAGEFEQAIPVLSILKEKNPERNIAVSFFSSSGYEMYAASDYADLFFYFPLDTKLNAQSIVEVLQPTCVVFIRNEIWMNTLLVLKEKNIPVYLVNANTNADRNFFYRNYLNKAYSLFTKVFGTKDFGNTKLERVLKVKNDFFSDDALNDFCKPEDMIVMLGSSWQEEERMMARFYKKNKDHYPQLKIIIAPHEFDDNKKFELSVLFGEAVTLYSEKCENSSRILLLDKKGILKYAYRYAQIAFIGGGMKKTVHNVSEASVYGTPTLFGPNYKKFEELADLVHLKVAYPVEDDKSFEEKLKELIEHESLRIEVKEKLDSYFSKQEKVAEKIVTEIA